MMEANKIFIYLIPWFIGLTVQEGFSQSLDADFDHYQRPYDPFNILISESVDSLETFHVMNIFETNRPPVSKFSNKAFFCRLEENIRQSSGIPVKFRLGSPEYVNWLEQKGSLFIR